MKFNLAFLQQLKNLNLNKNDNSAIMLLCRAQINFLSSDLSFLHNKDFNNCGSQLCDD